MELYTCLRRRSFLALLSDPAARRQVVAPVVDKVGTAPPFGPSDAPPTAPPAWIDGMSERFGFAVPQAASPLTSRRWVAFSPPVSPTCGLRATGPNGPCSGSPASRAAPAYGSCSRSSARPASVRRVDCAFSLSDGGGTPSPARSRDHPRARGVLQLPLAAMPHHGLIPACAGWSFSSCADSRASLDHPRPGRVDRLPAAEPIVVLASAAQPAAGCGRVFIGPALLRRVRASGRPGS